MSATEQSGTRQPYACQQVRFLVLKNLAAILAAAMETAPEALRLYGEAAMLDGGDIVLWNRLGTLVSAAGLLSGHLDCQSGYRPQPKHARAQQWHTTGQQGLKLSVDAFVALHCHSFEGDTDDNRPHELLQFTLKVQGATPACPACRPRSWVAWQ